MALDETAKPLQRHNDFALYDQALAAYRGGNRPRAQALLEAALGVQPAHVPSLILCGVIAGEFRELEKALRLFERALALQPDNAWAHCNKAFVLLLKGEWDQGWRHYEWRFRLERALSLQTLSGVLWQGRDSLQGKAILLRAEQGLGDTLQFCRYVKILADLGARVILEVPGPLVNLLADLEGLTQIVARGKPLPAHDYYCPLMSLPLAFGTRTDTIPSPSAYLVADLAKTAEWRARLGPGAPLIGLVWSGSAANTGDAYRSLPFADLYRHLPQGFRYVSLQKEVRPHDAQSLEAHPEVLQFSAEHHDFSDTAALCACMDLVICVETSVAHLSAGLGKQTWILLQHSPAWRWLLERTDCPWYSSATLYRQPVAGDWSSVCRRIGQQLKDSPLGAPRASPSDQNV